VVICLEQGADDLHMVQLMPLPHHHLCFSKIQNGLLFCYQLTKLVLEKKANKKVLLLLLLLFFISKLDLGLDYK